MDLDECSGSILLDQVASRSVPPGYARSASSLKTTSARVCGAVVALARDLHTPSLSLTACIVEIHAPAALLAASGYELDKSFDLRFIPRPTRSGG